ncbi:MAG TPA: hypothetical protein VD846_11895 [Allosphingosinicella sp.]|nr:hypothetical protein [Allosphingosinicella sp.]
MARGRKGRGGGPRITANKGRRLQLAGPSKRVLFDAERKERFLGYFCGEANLSWAARKVGVHYRTVLRHRATDPVFGEAYDLAEAQAMPRLRAWLAEAKQEEGRRFAEAALGRDGEEEEEEEPGGETAPARLSVDQAMQFLRDHEQSQARRERAARLGPGRGNGRPVSVASNEEVKAALVKALRAHGIRVRAGQASPDGEAADPSTTAFGGGPPPRSGEEQQ